MNCYAYFLGSDSGSNHQIYVACGNGLCRVEARTPIRLDFKWFRLMMNGRKGSIMLGVGGKREWPTFSKTAVRKELTNRLDLAN